MKIRLSKQILFGPVFAVFTFFFTLFPRASAGSFISVSPMTTARAMHTATQLPNGQVLVAGGQGRGTNLYLSSAEIYNPATGAWSAAASLNTARNQHTATLLTNANVMVAGGRGASSILSSVELYDPISSAWTMTGSLGTARVSHTATLLANGKVLVAGGLNSTSATASAELYNPAIGVWTATGSLNAARFGHTATLLADGKVLVAGGSGSGGSLASAELYDPVAGTWSLVGSMNTARVLHSATILPNGTVLVAGGYGSETLSSAEVYDPLAQIWVATNALNIARDSHTASLLADGELLVLGGTFADESGNVPVNIAEAYNPTNGTWTTNGASNVARYNHTATLLRGGQVLMAGGFGTSSALSSAEIFVPSSSGLVIQSVTLDGSNITFTWSAVMGSTYQVQYKTNLVSTSWTNLGGPVSATNSVMTGSDTISADLARKFYRIALLP